MLRLLRRQLTEMFNATPERSLKTGDAPFLVKPCPSARPASLGQLRTGVAASVRRWTLLVGDAAVVVIGVPFAIAIGIVMVIAAAVWIFVIALTLRELLQLTSG